MARTFALIAPVQYVLQQVSCSYEMIPNAPKYYETHRNIGIGSNGVDWLFSLRKIPMWLRGTNFCNNCTSSPCFAPTFMQLRNDPKCSEIMWNRLKHLFRVHQGGLVCLLRKIPSWLRGINFCINCTSSPRFALSFMQLRNDPKWTQPLWSTPKHEFRVQWGGSGAFVAKKLQRDFVGWTFVLTGPVQYVLHQVSYSYETIPNAPKYYETDRNISLESNRVDWVRLLWKIPTWHHGTNFYINCTSSPRFASSFLQLRNDPK